MGLRLLQQFVIVQSSALQCTAPYGPSRATAVAGRGECSGARMKDSLACAGWVSQQLTPSRLDKGVWHAPRSAPRNASKAKRGECLRFDVL